MEMNVAVEAILRFKQNYPGKRFGLVTDNSAVAWGLKAGYTGVYHKSEKRVTFSVS